MQERKVEQEFEERFDREVLRSERLRATLITGLFGLTFFYFLLFAPGWPQGDGSVKLL